MIRTDQPWRLVRLRIAAILILAMALLGGPARSEVQSFNSNRVINSVVYVAISDGRRPVGNGSGVIVAPGIVVTNAHVAAPGRRLFIIRDGGDGSDAIEAMVIVRSSADDLAILRAPGLIGRAMTIAAIEPGAGVPVWALGFPELADLASGEDRATNSLTSGTVSRVMQGRTLASAAGETTRLVQHSALIARGSSGGPLVDACYRLVGIHASLAINRSGTRLFSIASSVLPDLLQRAGVVASISQRECGPARRAGLAADRKGKDSGGKPSGRAAGSGAPAPAPPPEPAPEAIRDAPLERARDQGESVPDRAPSDRSIAPAPIAEQAPEATSKERQLEIARQRAADARRREAAALAARRRALAANDSGEAERQARIAASSKRLAEEMDDYSSSLQSQLDAIDADPLERYGPIVLALLAALALGATYWFFRKRQEELARRKEAVSLALRLTESQLAARAAQNVTLVSPEGALKLPGAGLLNGLIVGRSADHANVVLAKETVGRTHAKFVMIDDQHSGAHPPTFELFVTDLGSTNGTLVNGKRLPDGTPHRLTHGDRIAFSRLHEFTVQIERGR